MPSISERILAFIGSIARRYTSASLFLTRSSLYGASLFTSIVVVLLPISIITYLNFYKMLVPAERFAVPAMFFESRTAISSKVASDAVIDPSKALSFLERNRALAMSVRLNLNAVCFVEQSYHLLQYVFKLTPEIIRENSFIINCDSRYIYVTQNSWVPYNLRYWVPPVFVDIFKTVSVDWPLYYSTGADLVRLLTEQTSHFQFLDTKPIIIDNSKTTLDFVIEWEGIRYYLVNYYFTSLFIGVLIFWGASTFICMVSTLYFYTKFSSDDEPERSHPARKQAAKED